MLVARLLPAIVGAFIFSSTIVHAEDYPTRPIHVYTAQAGGGNDIPARIIGQQLAVVLGQPIIIENRVPLIATVTAGKAAPDGYSLLFQSDSMWTVPFIQPVPYDPVKDFTPISLTGRIPTVMVVNNSVPAHSIKELVALAKSKPGQLNYAISGLGSATHLSAELFKSMTGTNMVAIPYTGGPEAIVSLLGNQVQIMFPVVNTVMSQIKSGQLRALGVSTLEPSPLAPGIPTIASAGLPGFQAASTQGFFAPSKVSPEIIAKLNKAILQVLAMPGVKEKLLNIGVETVGSSPTEFADYVKNQMAVAGKLLKAPAGSK